MNNPKVKIYALIDPITLEIRYIGKTIRSLYDRFYQHFSNLKENTYKCNWIKSLRKRGLRPIIELIEEVEFEEWENMEKFYISYFRYIGCDLTNHAEGGSGYVESKAKNVKPKRKANCPVIQLTLEGEFVKEWESHKEFAKFYGLKSLHIRNGSTCRGFILVKKKDYNPNKHYNVTTKHIPNTPIEMLDMNNVVIKEFKNSKEASIYLKMTQANIRIYCRGKLLNKKFSLRYKHDDINRHKTFQNTNNNVQTYKKRGKTRTANNPVLYFDLKMNFIKEFLCRKDAANYFNLHPSMISIYCLNPNKIKKPKFILQYKF